MDVIRFINKHNIKWFERPQIVGTAAHVSENKINNSISSNNNNATRKFEPLRNSMYVDDYDRSEPNKANRESTKATAFVSSTSPPPTVPSITINKETTTKYAPAWKNLINKAVKSNKIIDALAQNIVDTADQTPPVVMRTTKLYAQKTTTPVPTLRPNGTFVILFL